MKVLQLKYFCAVCKFGNITAASRELYVSQPTISVAVKELEDELGVNLFRRDNNKLTLTPEGKVFLADCEEILKRAEDLTKKMSDFSEKSGVLKIGVPPMIGSFLFYEMYTRYKKKYPDARFETHEHGSLGIAARVNAETVNLGITILNDEIKREFNSLSLMKTRIVFCCRKDNPLAGKKVLTLDDIKDEPLILMREGSFQNKLVRALYAGGNLEPKVELYAGQLYTIKRFIANLPVSAFLIKECIFDTDKDLAGVPLAYPEFDIEIGLIYKKDIRIYKDAKKFIDFSRTFVYGGG